MASLLLYDKVLKDWELNICLLKIIYEIEFCVLSEILVMQ